MKRRSSLALFALAALSLLVGEARADDALDAEGDAGTRLRRPAVGLSGIELDELESDFSPEIERLVIPPYYRERSERLELQLFFPFVFHRERSGEGARTDLGVMPFYWRYREGNRRADVVFPLYWQFRLDGSDTDIVLQTYLNRSPNGFNFGFAPLVFFGRDSSDDSSYQVVPPLLWHFQNGPKDFLLAGIYYDVADGDDFDRGLPPLYFAGRERDETYLVAAPPLFWRFTDEIAYTTKTVVPPFFYNTREHGWSFGMMPLLYFARDRDWDRTMVLPFYFGSRWQEEDKTGEVLGEGRSHYLPFLLTYYRHGPELSQGGSTIFYHWYEYKGEFLRMFSPLVWLWGNERSAERSVLVPPLFYRGDSPVSDDTMVGLLYWNFHKHHRERTFALAPLFGFNRSLYEDRWRAWVAPTFDFGVQPDGYHARLHPLFYRGKDATSDHLVIAPLIWKFTDEEDDNLVLFPFWWGFNDLQHDASSKVAFPLFWRFEKRWRQKTSTVVFPLWWDFDDGRDENRTVVLPPLFWRDRDKRSTMTGVLNVVWHEGKVKNNPFWTFKLFPFISFGHPPAPEGAYWEFLHGFIGWRRQGRTKELKLLWIPIDLSD